MSEAPHRKETSLIPTGTGALTTRSSPLVKRGLETLASFGGRIVRFPADRSMGKFWTYDPAVNIDDVRQEACGDVTVPLGKKLALMVNDESVFDLSPLASLKPDDLQRLYFLEDKVFDKDLVHIKQLRFLEELWLVDCGQISDAGLAHVGELTGLKFLFLGRAHITDAGLVYLKNLTELEVLNLVSCASISDVGLSHVVALKNLRHLHLDGTQISGAGLAYLHQLTLLTSLSISNAEIFDADVAQHIRGLTNLRRLGLGGTHITDDGLSYLRRLNNLQHLDLSSCAISDSGLVHLQNLTALDLLDLSHSNIGPTAINRLQEALPNCRVGPMYTWVSY
jgi:Leucine-rich repeat (LRR) protein